jgi:hypothetical protein
MRTWLAARYPVYSRAGALILLLACFSHAPVLAQVDVLPSERSVLPTDALDELIKEERLSPTDASNVRERYMRLIQNVRALADAGYRDVIRRILPKEQAESIGEQLRNGEMAAAVDRVRSAIKGLDEAVKSKQIAGLPPRSVQPHPIPMSQPASTVDSEMKSAATAGAPAQAQQVINFHALATRGRNADILKLFNCVINERKRELYVTGSKTTTIGVVDLNKDELVRTFDAGIYGGFLIINSNTLYSYDFGAGKCYQIDTDQGRAREVSVSDCQSILPRDKDKPKQWGGYLFYMTGYRSRPNSPPGFDVGWRQDLNAAYGVIEISDASKKKLGEILTGPDALYFTIDGVAGKLYSTNTGDGSLSVFDLHKLESTGYCKDNGCRIKDIDVGTSADQVIEDSSGKLYVRNRLGGSVIYKYKPSTGAFSVIENENHVPGGIGLWPTAMELSGDEKRLYVLSHYGASIDVIDTSIDRVINKIPFALSLKPRTDSISTMVLDKAHDILYAVWPETGIIGAAKGITGMKIGTVDLSKYGFNKAQAANAGPGLINLAVNEKTGTLYAYLFNEQKLLVFNGKTLAVERESSFSMERKREMSLFCNDDKGVLYLGNKIIDETGQQVTGIFPRGQAVVGFNNRDNTVFVIESSPSFDRKGSQETMLEYNDGKMIRQWTLDRTGSINSRFFFNFRKGYFLAAYFESGTVKKYNF